MTGTLLLAPPVPPPYARVRIELDGRTVWFSDPRRFGTGELVLGAPALERFISARLGIEPFDERFNGPLLRSLAAGRRGPLKPFLLDQRNIAGIGNIYADEALFRARLHPLRRAGSLTPRQYALLADAIRDALAAGIDARGASIDDFRHLDGARGSFQDRFLVHRRQDEPCSVCATTIEKLTVGGRGTYVCRHCQPVPRARSGLAR
jgi:formamidopyrimidine-DNA glycosylase